MSCGRTGSDARGSHSGCDEDLLIGSGEWADILVCGWDCTDEEGRVRLGPVVEEAKSFEDAHDERRRRRGLVGERPDGEGLYTLD